MNVFIDIDIDIDIFKSDLIDIDIDIDILKKCRYIDNRYDLSIYRTPLITVLPIIRTDSIEYQTLAIYILH